MEKKLIKLETENVPKQFKINENILKMLLCIENANINNQGKCHVSKVICFRVTPKTNFASKFPFFLNFNFIFLGAFENYWDF